jgi:hypothetical protein
MLRNKLNHKVVLIGSVLLIALVFGAVGVVRQRSSHAATASVSAEAENGTVTSTATVVTDATASNGKAIKFAGTVNPSAMPAAPTGYKLWNQWDFRNMGTSLPSGWTAQNSPGGNSAGTYRAQNVAVVPGVGLVHTAERDSVGAPIYTGRVFGKVAVPQYMHVRFKAKMTGFKSGTWPSFWARPQSGGSMEGEKDFVEGFAGHISGSAPRIWGGGYIVTPYPAVGLDTVSFNTAIPQSTWDSEHVYETQQVPGKATMSVDGTEMGTVTAAGMSTAAARAAYATQFDDPSATWYLRTDFQISGTGTQAGVTNAGLLTSDQVGKFATWTIEWVQVFVPN